MTGTSSVALAANANWPAIPPGSNPFSTRWVRPGAIEYRFDFDSRNANRSVESILQRLAIGGRGLIVGPHGSGKSSLLQTLLPHLRRSYAQVCLLQTHAKTESNWFARLSHRWRTGRLAWQQTDRLPPHSLLIVDGIEQLAALDRLLLIAQLRPRRLNLLATSHRRLPFLATLYQTQVTPDLIMALVQSRLAGGESKLRGQIAAELAQRDLTKLENIRELWFDLYDIAQSSQMSLGLVQEGI